MFLKIICLCYQPYHGILLTFDTHILWEKEKLTSLSYWNHFHIEITKTNACSSNFYNLSTKTYSPYPQGWCPSPNPCIVSLNPYNFILLRQHSLSVIIITLVILNVTFIYLHIKSSIKLWQRETTLNFTNRGAVAACIILCTGSSESANTVVISSTTAVETRQSSFLSSADKRSDAKSTSCLQINKQTNWIPWF